MKITPEYVKNLADVHDNLTKNINETTRLKKQQELDQWRQKSIDKAIQDIPNVLSYIKRKAEKGEREISWDRERRDREYNVTIHTELEKLGFVVKFESWDNSYQSEEGWCDKSDNQYIVRIFI